MTIILHQQAGLRGRAPDSQDSGPVPQAQSPPKCQTTSNMAPSDHRQWFFKGHALTGGWVDCEVARGCVVGAFGLVPLMLVWFSLAKVCQGVRQETLCSVKIKLIGPAERHQKYCCWTSPSIGVQASTL